MSAHYQPLIKAKLLKLHPTQMTVGMAEVQKKRQHWRLLDKKQQKQFLLDNTFPAVRGADGVYYITDHHHLGVALLQEGIESVYLVLLRDLSQLNESSFWMMMESQHWVHPFDNHGVRQPVTKIPSKLDKLKDDPYRSLAGEVRKAGGYPKDSTPFSEFLWADFFRSRIDLTQVSLKKALPLALTLCHTPEASYLPGWSGVHHEQG